MEVKKTGRIDHSANTHDDQIFSYLLALYVWYYGKNLKELFNIDKRDLTTDQDEIDEIITFEDKKNEIILDLNRDIDSPIEKSLADAAKASGILYHDWEKKEALKDEIALKQILMYKPGREAYLRKYNMTEDQLPKDDDFDEIDIGLYGSVFEDLDMLTDSYYEEDEYRYEQ